MPKLNLSKAELNKRKLARLKKETDYRINYQKEKYKFINVQFRLDDEKDKQVLEFLENQQESRATVIKKILYDYLENEKK